MGNYRGGLKFAGKNLREKFAGKKFAETCIRKIFSRKFSTRKPRTWPKFAGHVLRCNDPPLLPNSFSWLKFRSQIISRKIEIRKPPPTKFFPANLSPPCSEGWAPQDWPPQGGPKGSRQLSGTYVPFKAFTKP